MSKNGHNSATKSVCWNCGQTLEDHPHPVWGWRRETQNSHRRAPMAKSGRPWFVSATKPISTVAG